MIRCRREEIGRFAHFTPSEHEIKKSPFNKNNGRKPKFEREWHTVLLNESSVLLSNMPLISSCLFIKEGSPKQNHSRRLFQLQHRLCNK